MTRKLWILLTVVVVLGGLSLYLNKDWFAKDNIQISHRSRPDRISQLFRRKKSDSAVNPVVFILNHKLKLTSLKVIPVSDIKTNKFPHPIWYLTSDSNSVPTQEFTYGDSIRGMRPAVKDASAWPLEPGVNYRLLIEAGELKAEHDFAPVPRT